MKKGIFILISLWITLGANAATITSNAVTGNWTSTASWVGGVVPGVNDSVVIVSGAVITMNSNAVVYKMVINSGGTFNLSDDTLTLAGNTVLGGNLTVYGTFNGNTGMVYLTGNFYCNGAFNAGTSTFNFNGNDAQTMGGTTLPVFYHLISSNTNNTTGKGLSLHPVNTIITGNMIANGVFARNSQSNPNATVTFDGNTQLSGIYSFYLNHVVINSGATLRGGLKTIYLYGDFTCGGTFVCESSTVDVRQDTYSSCQPNNQVIAVDNSASNPFYNLTITKSSGKVSPAPLGSNALGHLYVLNNYNLSGGTWDVNGTRQLWVGGNFTVNTTATFSASQGRLIMNGSGAGQQMLNTGGDTLYKLTINNTGGGVRLSVNAVVTFDLTLTSGLLYTRNGALNNEIFLTNSDPVNSLPAGYSATSYVKGSLRRAVTATTYVFPVGVSNSIGSDYRPVTLNLSALNGTTSIVVSQDSIANSSTWYADWWARVLPAGGNPSGTMTFTYQLAGDFASGMNECAIMVSRGTPTPSPSWSYVLIPSGTASGGSVTVAMPADFSPYAYILGEPMPVASGTTICAGNTSLLNIASPGGYGSFDWYSAQTGGSLLASSALSYTTPVLNATTTYWMAYTGTPCAAHRWPVTVTVNPIPTSAFTVSQPTCATSCGTITYTGTGSSSATYTWNFGTGTATPGTGQGPHNVCFASPGSANVSLTVTENGCVSTATTNNVSTPQPIQVNATVNDASCGAANGSVSLNVTGGWGAYSYSWAGGQTTPSVANLSAGNYPVTITDAGNCTFTGSYSVSNLGAPVVSAGINQHVSCHGGNDAEVSFSASGTGTLTYNWSNGINGNGSPVNITIDTLSAGSYQYTVTDANSCITSGTFTINEPDPLVILPVSTPPLCYGQNNGSISVSATGGSPAYTWNWAHGSSQPSQINLAAGTYTVTASDQNGCTATQTITLSEPDSIIIGITTAPISCFGENDGAINTSVSGGTSPYTYSWTGGYTDPGLDSLSNGTYNLSLLDANNCAATASVVLSQPFPVDIVLNTTDVDCYGTPGGAVYTAVNGGTAPYSFLWDNGATTQQITNLYAGIYWVTVTDDHGCTSVGSTGIQQPDSILVTVIAASLLCNGDMNGSVQTFASGGVSPYSYLWNTGATTSSLQNLGAGTYTVTLSDANGCSSVHSSAVSQPPVLAAVYTTTHVSCYGYNNGEMSVAVSGGSPGYEITWPDGTTGSTASQLTAGTYVITVSDANSCEDTFTNTILQPDTMITDATFSATLCWGDTTGFIALTTTGGTLPYTYLWSDNSTTGSIQQLSPGTYSYTVTDAGSCTNSQSIALGATSPVSVELIPDYVAGQLSAVASGGTLPYTFAWNNGNTDSLLSPIQSAFYSVTITDDYGCQAEAAMTIFYELKIPSAFTPNGDGTNDTWEIEGIGAYQEVSIEIFNRWGDVVFRYFGDGMGYTESGKQWDGFHNGNNMPAGVYLYIVKLSGINEPFQGTIVLMY